MKHFLRFLDQFEADALRKSNNRLCCLIKPNNRLYENRKIGSLVWRFYFRFLLEIQSSNLVSIDISLFLSYLLLLSNIYFILICCSQGRDNT